MKADPAAGTPGRGALMVAACNTACDYVLYRKYDSADGAIKSLRRRCKGFTTDQYRRALDRAIEAWGVVGEVIAPFHPPGDVPGLIAWAETEAAAQALRRRCPAFRLATCREISRFHLYYHWR